MDLVPRPPHLHFRTARPVGEVVHALGAHPDSGHSRRRCHSRSNSNAMFSPQSIRKEPARLALIILPYVFPVRLAARAQSTAEHLTNNDGDLQTTTTATKTTATQQQRQQPVSTVCL